MPDTRLPSLDIPGLDGHDDLSPRSPHEEDHSHTSDDEYQHALEVVFDPESSYRRKSSLVAADSPARLIQRRKETACFVHSLLEDQRNRGVQQDGLAGIAKALDGRRIGCQERALRKEVEPNGIGDTAARSTEAQQLDDQVWRLQLSHSPEADPKLRRTRLLTKRQLSDMTLGVRELSKRLGSIRLRLQVKTIFILTKTHDETLIENTRAVARWLLSDERQVRYTVYVEERLRDNKKFDARGLLEELEKGRAQKSAAVPVQVDKDNKRRLCYWTDEMCQLRPHTFDFVITLGGDGTVLYASWLFQRIVPPVLSFALGSLGFLTKFDYNEFEGTLTRALRDGVLVSLRLRFEGTVMRSQTREKSVLQNSESVTDGQDADNIKEDEKPRDLVEELVGEEKDGERTHRPDVTYEILNDIVVDRGPNPTMSSTEIFGGDEHFTTVQADGVCVATPTGSTAYNLAAGGSLCHPDNPVILVTAICAHTLSFRPIILPDTIVLRIGVPYDARTSSWASFDGRERVELRPGDYVTISASRFPFANVMPEGRRSEDWINSISGKLGWNTRQRQKSYREWD